MAPVWLDRMVQALRRTGPQAPQTVDSPLPMPDLWTPRLRLRPFRDGDAPGIYSYASDAQTARYMVWGRHRSLADSEASLEYFKGSYRRGDDQPIAIVRRKDGQIIGCTGFQYPLRRSPWAAWILRSDSWGQGLASEAMSSLLAWGWKVHPRWIQVEAPIHPKNTGSIYLAKKLGFVEVPCDLKFKMTNLGGRMHKSTNWVLKRPA